MINIKILEKESVNSLNDIKCDILFVEKEQSLLRFLDKIEHNLLETPNIRYIVVEDKELFNFIKNNYSLAFDTKIEESYISGRKDKILMRFFRIKEKKLFTVIKNFRNYFYVLDPNGKYITIDNKRVSKCYNYFNNNPIHYEKDINIMTRYAVEQSKKNRLVIGKNYRICYFDIETNASVDAVNTPEAIISIVANDNLTGENKYWEIRELKEELEKEMLEDFFKYVSKFDILAGFNITKFDIPYLLNRAKKVGVNLSLITGIKGCYPSAKYKGGDNQFPWFNTIPGINIIDLINLAEKSINYLGVKLPDKKLDTLGRYILNESKVETDTPAVLFKNKNFDKLKEYNIQDVNITLKLDKKLGLIEVLLNTIELVKGLNIDTAVWNSKIIDFYLLTKTDVVLPSVDRNREKNIKGATVTKTIPGVYDNVAIMDVSGMYPSLIRSFNISPDTKDANGDIKISNFTFTSKKTGILTKLIDDFTALRAKYKQLLKKHKGSTKDYKLLQLKEFTVKKILASVYGVFGFIGFRLFDNDIANAITFAGRELLAYMNKTAEDNGYIVLSSDTDGNCLKHKEDNPNFEELEKILNNNLKNWMKNYTTNEKIINNHKIIIEYETLFKRIIFTKAKKKYMGLVSVMKGKKLDKLTFYGKGNELVRKDTPAGIKEELRKIIMDVLLCPDKSKILDLIKTRVFEIKKSLLHWSKEDLIIYKEINRDFDDYKVIPMHVRGAISSNKYLNTNFSRQNYKGGYIFVKSRKYPDIDVLFINENTELTEDFDIDYDKYFEKFIVRKIDLIFGEEIYVEVFRKNKSIYDYIK